MSSMINQFQKALRQYVPMIKFRYGAYSSTHASNGSKNESNILKNIDSTSPITNQGKSSQKSVSLEFSQTPKKYRRRPLTQDEIDLVTVGGFN